MTQHDFAAIEELDLDPIKVKLMHEESGEGWSLEHANAVEKEYRRFLYLMKKYPEEQAAPLMDVDTFWHYHILDTLKYAVDCEKVFGYFLHHFPYVGLRGEADEEAHHQMGERMRELYEETFGEDYIRAGATAWSARAPEREATTAWSARAPEGAKTAWSARAPEGVKTAWSARAPEGVKTAWSARAPEGVKTAWSARAPEGMAAKTAWSARAPESLAAQTAWSARAPAGLKTAWSARAVATAWSASPSRQAQGATTVAWSASPTRQADAAPTVAWSASPSRQADAAPTVAWSASPSRQADAAPAANWSERATVDSFYTERPRLPQAETAA